MDPIEEIVEHISAAENDDAINDVHRWTAARLISEELARSHDSLRELGEKIGKSHMFVQYMKRAWEVAGKPIFEMPTDPAAIVYPDFKGVYYSVEVRGKPKTDKPAKAPRGSKSVNKQADESAHGMLTEAARILHLIAENDAFWSLLSEADIDLIEGIIIDAEQILAG